MPTPPPPSSPAFPTGATDAVHWDEPPDKRPAPGKAPAPQFPDEILKAIAEHLGKKGSDNLCLADSTFKQAVFMAPHLKSACPNDLLALIAAHTDAHGRTDCSHIGKITLSHSSFTDTDLALLQDFTSLHEVDCSDCTNITGAGAVWRG